MRRARAGVRLEGMTGASDEAATVEGLIAEERLREAAALCHAQGDVARAVDLLERAAAFAEAAQLAVDHGMGARALRLAAPFGPDELLAEASRRMEAPEAKSLGYDLAARGLYRAAAHAFRAVGLSVEEGEAWERAGEPVEAALGYVRGGETIRAARALTARLSQQPGDTRASLELGRLLVASGKLEAAARTLQGIGEEAPEGARARRLLGRVLGRLGLQEARSSLGEVGDEEEEPARVESAEGLLYGRYVVQRQVATTPTARVFACHDRLADQAVAVKVLRVGAGGLEGRDALGRFRREAQALGLLRHPNILPLLSFVAEGPALVTPWMSGGSMADVLATTALSPDRAVELSRAVLGALSDAHRLGILHRDVKPSNVLMDAAGAAYLADFGAAHLGDSAATVTAGLIGSLAYMAPEVVAGGKASVASDLYGVGALLYEALTSEQPAPADEVTVWPSQVHGELGTAHDELVGRLLARLPERRPATALEAMEALRAVSFRVTAPPRARKARGRPRAAGTRERRLMPLDGGGMFDGVLRRRVRLVASNGHVVALGRAWAQAERDELATIYRVDAEAGALWVEDLEGVPLAVAGRRLRADERERLRAALEALHQRGVAHGQVDGEHVRLSEQRGVVLMFPGEARATATAEADLAALRELSAPEGNA